MRFFRVSFWAVSLPGSVSIPTGMVPEAGLLRLTEATSNTGCDMDVVWDWAWAWDALITPKKNGPATDRIAAAAKSSFLLKLRRHAIRPAMMLPIRFFKSAPVIPDTHASGDSTYSLHTLRIPAA